MDSHCTHTGVDFQTRELLIFSVLVTLGKCEARAMGYVARISARAPTFGDAFPEPQIYTFDISLACQEASCSRKELP
jgi:hypothetical protein